MKTAFVLSGGGARGLSHIGALKALYEHEIYPEVISGTSAGAFIGALLAYGYNPDEILAIFLKTSLRKYLGLSYTLSGFLSLEKAENLLKIHIPENSFESLKIPLVVTATDILAGEEVYYRKGELAKPVLASCALPGIFKPVQFDGKHLIDGAIFHNLPVAAIENEADYIVGIHCNPIEMNKGASHIPNILYRSFRLAMRGKARASLDRCDLLIEAPELSAFNPFDFRKGQQIFDIGYRYTKNLLKKENVEIENLKKSGN